MSSNSVTLPIQFFSKDSKEKTIKKGDDKIVVETEIEMIPEIIGGGGGYGANGPIGNLGGGASASDPLRGESTYSTSMFYRGNQHPQLFAIPPNMKQYDFHPVPRIDEDPLTIMMNPGEPLDTPPEQPYRPASVGGGSAAPIIQYVCNRNDTKKNRPTPFSMGGGAGGCPMAPTTAAPACNTECSCPKCRSKKSRKPRREEEDDEEPEPETRRPRRTQPPIEDVMMAATPPAAPRWNGGMGYISAPAAPSAGGESYPTFGTFQTVGSDLGGNGPPSWNKGGGEDSKNLDANAPTKGGRGGGAGPMTLDDAYSGLGSSVTGFLGGSMPQQTLAPMITSAPQPTFLPYMGGGGGSGGNNKNAAGAGSDNAGMMAMLQQQQLSALQQQQIQMQMMSIKQQMNQYQDQNAGTAQQSLWAQYTMLQQQLQQAGSSTAYCATLCNQSCPSFTTASPQYSSNCNCNYMSCVLNQGGGDSSGVTIPPTVTTQKPQQPVVTTSKPLPQCQYSMQDGKCDPITNMKIRSMKMNPDQIEGVNCIMYPGFAFMTAPQILSCGDDSTIPPMIYQGTTTPSPYQQTTTPVSSYQETTTPMGYQQTTTPVSSYQGTTTPVSSYQGTTTSGPNTVPS